MRLDREQKNVIYKASVDWNLSSDPLAAAQLICSWFQTTPPRRPRGTFFRFYAWIYLFNSPFTKTTADDSTNKSLREKKKKYRDRHRHTQTCLDRTKPLGFGHCWGYEEGKNRGRGWSWGVFCMEDMDESSTQFLNLLWSAPLVFFCIYFPM